MGLWEAELGDKIAGNCLVYKYQGQSRIRNADKLARSFHVVLVTYDTLAADFNAYAKKHPDAAHNTFPPLGTIQWHRVVLDESQKLCNPDSSYSRACAALHSSRRWCCSPTPCNDIMHLIGQAAFLHMEPLNDKTVFTDCVRPNFCSASFYPLRRICSGGCFSDRDLKVPMIRNMTPSTATIPCDVNLVAPEDDVCAICLEEMFRPCKTPCNHWFCRECIQPILSGPIYGRQDARCPMCRLSISTAQLIEGTSANPPADDQDDGQPNGQPSSESKLRALLRELRAMREQDGSAKALVFSQHLATLEWPKPRLVEAGFAYRSLAGTRTINQRQRAILDFQSDTPGTVFLLSMRAGSVGINLTAANYVFLLEPAINPALEDQAIGRAWRMGQARPVTVKRFFIKGSIEERIMEVVKQRREGTFLTRQFGPRPLMLRWGQAIEEHS
ncbi:hypothetical protein WJX72_002146 [[Myrmecia] bisecta]|uniref:Uncharacterized protein n=1 Tax=[Myrmecia] bisecta TaxID=41462 RepID=A0AAW1P8I4_9CHLO